VRSVVQHRSTAAVLAPVGDFMPTLEAARDGMPGTVDPMDAFVAPRGSIAVSECTA
jgi:hypothetical protein